jgi:hypothetical protein
LGKVEKGVVWLARAMPFKIVEKPGAGNTNAWFVRVKLHHVCLSCLGGVEKKLDKSCFVLDSASMGKHLTAGSAHLLREMDQFLNKAGVPKNEQDLDGATISAVASIVAFTQQCGLTERSKAQYMAMVGAIFDEMQAMMQDDFAESN